MHTVPRVFLNGNPSWVVEESRLSSRGNKQDKTADDFSQHATRKAPAQPPNGAGPVTANNLASLQKPACSRALYREQL